VRLKLKRQNWTGVFTMDQSHDSPSVVKGSRWIDLMMSPIWVLMRWPIA